MVPRRLPPVTPLTLCSASNATPFWVISRRGSSHLGHSIAWVRNRLVEACTKAARRFEELGCIVEEASPDIGAADEAFHTLRGQHFIVDRELQLRNTRDKLKPDIIWNTERGLGQTPSEIARADRERAAFYQRMIEFFGSYDLLVTSGGADTCFRRQPAQRRDDRRPEARQLSGRLDRHGGDHAFGLSRNGRSLRFRSIRQTRRPAVRRHTARRSRPASGRGVVRRAVRFGPTLADRPQSRRRSADDLKPIEHSIRRKLATGRALAQCTSATPVTGTPDAPGLLTPSKRRASSSRLALM